MFGTIDLIVNSVTIKEFDAFCFMSYPKSVFIKG